MYKFVGKELPGKVAIKLHSGEEGDQYFLKPEFWKPVIDAVSGRIVESNTAYGFEYGGVRDTTEGHRHLLEEHGWTKYFDVDLMDAEGPDVELPIPNGKVLKKEVVSMGWPLLRKLTIVFAMISA